MIQVNSVRRARGGDGATFGALYEAYAPEVHRYLRLRTTEPDRLVAAMTTNVFEQAFEQLERGRADGATFGAVLYRIARDHIIQHHQRARHRSAIRVVDAWPGRPAPAATAPGPVLQDRAPSAA